MNESTSTWEGLVAGLQNILVQVLEYLPRVAIAVLVLVLGWLMARLIRKLIVRAIERLDKLWQRLILKKGVEQRQPSHPPIRMVGELVFWMLILISVTLATEILGLEIFGVWIKEIVTYLPLALAGFLIVLVGFMVSSLARDLVASAADSAGLSHGDLMGRTAQVVILFIAIIIGVDQLGIDIAFLTMVTGIVLAALFGGIAFAFGMGARTHVSNIIAANQLRNIYQIGDRVRIGDIEGRIMDIDISRVIIETEVGTVDVPAKLFDEQVTIITEKGS
jgi:small-conductance mechanosensitive channel